METNLNLEARTVPGLLGVDLERAEELHNLHRKFLKETINIEVDLMEPAGGSSGAGMEVNIKADTREVFQYLIDEFHPSTEGEIALTGYIAHMIETDIKNAREMFGKLEGNHARKSQSLADILAGL